MLLPVHTLIADALPPTMTVDAAAQFLGISRSTAYTLSTRFRDTGGKEGLPNVRFGSRVLVLTAPLLELLRLSPGADTDEALTIALSTAGAPEPTGLDPS
jgi:transposase